MAQIIRKTVSFFAFSCLVLSAKAQVSPTGADPTGKTDSYTALQNAINTAISTSSELDIPTGTYMVSKGLVATSNAFRMRCAGANVTSIAASAAGYNTLVVGTGTTGLSIGPNGYISDCKFSGAGKPSVSDGHSALQLNGAVQYDVRNVTVDYADIGIDLINNNFGSQFTNVRGGFAGDLNVGINLRTGSQSGSDLVFNNPWITGQIAGVYIAGGGGGYHFFGGQIGAGSGTFAAVDTSGAIVMGKDYLSGATGESSADFHGTSFESTNFAWVFRTFNQINLSLTGISANPASSSSPAIGFFKGDSMNNSHVTLTATTLSGNWSNAAMVVGNGAWPAIWWIEEGTYTAANNPVIHGTQTYVNSLAAQAGIQAHAYYVGISGPVFQGVTL